MNTNPTLASAELPAEIREAALTISQWVKENGAGDWWEMYDLCSRKYADHARSLDAKLRRLTSDQFNLRR